VIYGSICWVLEDSRQFSSRLLSQFMKSKQMAIKPLTCRTQKIYLNEINYVTIHVSRIYFSTLNNIVDSGYMLSFRVTKLYSSHSTVVNLTHLQAIKYIHFPEKCCLQLYVLSKGTIRQYRENWH